MLQVAAAAPDQTSLQLCSLLVTPTTTAMPWAEVHTTVWQARTPTPADCAAVFPHLWWAASHGRVCWPQLLRRRRGRGDAANKALVSTQQHWGSTHSSCRDHQAALARSITTHYKRVCMLGPAACISCRHTAAFCCHHISAAAEPPPHYDSRVSCLFGLHVLQKSACAVMLQPASSPLCCWPPCWASCAVGARGYVRACVLSGWEKGNT